MSPSVSTKYINQYVAIQQGGPFELVKQPYPEPGPDEICIRNRAVALNPLDVKSLHHGVKVQAWPAILGIDVSGVVEAVGKDVKDIKVGDPVMSLAGFGGRAGGFQDVTTVPAHFACPKPAEWTFEEAASVPICYLVAAATLTHGLRQPLPTPPRPTPATVAADPDILQHKLLSPITPTTASAFPFNFSTTSASSTSILQPPTPKLSSVLILGGASGVGASTIQLLRAALGKEVTIISSNSPVHNKTVESHLGATACVDRNQPLDEFVADAKSKTEGGKGVDAIVDAVGVVAQIAEEEEKGKIFQVLRDGGSKMYSTVVTGASGEESGAALPKGVKGVKRAVVVGRMAFMGKNGYGVMRRLGELVEEKRFGLPLAVEVVGHGLEAIEGGLEKLKGGVSGTKLVVSL